MRQWCLSFKNPKTSSWPPFTRTMWAPLQVRNNFILLLADPPSLLLQQSPIMHTPSSGCSIPAPSSLEVLLSPPKQADKSLFVINCMFSHVINQYLNPTEEPHKPGTKEKRKKAASFQTVSQLHKVRARPSSKPTREACSEHPSINPTSLLRLQGTLHTNSWALKNPKASRELSWLGKSS